ncbi:MAG: threonylcarbamoyl-AMP synthase [Candidatus Marinimicrobia bacterium]|nr:threonylcarbamoyl-AMP synthase [Candidatus Neomarinimicrobiota bacterium]
MKSVVKILQALELGETVILPTDTLNGLSCDATSKTAVQNLRNLKKMSNEKPISVMFADIETLQNWIEIPPKFTKLLDFLPGALTIIGNAKQDLPVVSEQNTLGCRVPNHPITLEICATFGKPITTTSVNISGFPSVANCRNLPTEMKARIDQIIWDDNLKQSNGSTIVDISSGELVVLRTGILPFESLACKVL